VQVCESLRSGCLRAAEEEGVEAVDDVAAVDVAVVPVGGPERTGPGRVDVVVADLARVRRVREVDDVDAAAVPGRVAAGAGAPGPKAEHGRRAVFGVLVAWDQECALGCRGGGLERRDFVEPDTAVRLRGIAMAGARRGFVAEDDVFPVPGPARRMPD